MSDTVFALATAPGRAAVAIVRLSGPAVRTALAALTPGSLTPRRAALRALKRPRDAALIDQALVLWFPGPASFTGEDCAELHLHGGAAVLEAAIEALLAQGLRLAEPGEFTRRAFEHGKLDLAQAEAVADLVDAETEAQRRQALAQLDGELSGRHEAWRLALIDALAGLEATVDFPDEDLPEAVVGEIRAPIAAVAEEIHEALAGIGRGERVREGFRIALIGAPNAGKSSLLNRLAQRDAAIVTPIPGTTRDVIEVALDLAGYRVLVADTAGLRATDDPIEIEGVRRAEERAVQADLRILVVDQADAGNGWRFVQARAEPSDLLLLNKGDLPGGADGVAAGAWAAGRGLEVFRISLRTGEGLDAALAALTARVIKALSGAEFPAATRERHRRDLAGAGQHLQRALAALDMGGAMELVAEDVRLGARCLSRISGRIDPEDVLDRVFARFCIGK